MRHLTAYSYTRYGPINSEKKTIYMSQEGLEKSILGQKSNWRWSQLSSSPSMGKLGGNQKKKTPPEKNNKNALRTIRYLEYNGRPLGLEHGVNREARLLVLWQTDIK